MRLDTTHQPTCLVLSRRNVMALLAKLDMAGSARTIYTDDPSGKRLVACACETLEAGPAEAHQVAAHYPSLLVRLDRTRLTELLDGRTVSDLDEDFPVFMEVDDEHYRGREAPGVMHPQTERDISRMA